MGARKRALCCTMTGTDMEEKGTRFFPSTIMQTNVDILFLEHSLEEIGTSEASGCAGILSQPVLLYHFSLSLSQAHSSFHPCLRCPRAISSLTLLILRYNWDANTFSCAEDLETCGKVIRWEWKVMEIHKSSDLLPSSVLHAHPKEKPLFRLQTGNKRWISGEVVV